VRVDGRRLGAGWVLVPGGILRIEADAPGRYLLRLRPLGALPWPPVRVVAVPVPEVAPGGESVGVLLGPRGFRLWGAPEAAGIGTLTLYDPYRRVFAALGHAVRDPRTGRPVEPAHGELVPSVVAGVAPSRQGAPGEKLGVLVGGQALGLIRANTPVGVIGSLLRPPAGGAAPRPVPVALPDQVHPGPATLLTVLRGTRVAAFRVRILAVQPDGPPGGRDVAVEVVDPRLLAAAGGIVQGMSGSPILQDGRLVGALTHVFVDDPRRGYGVFAAWMSEAAGLGPPAAEIPPG
jgi:stage IV sporulation protein B